MRTPGPRAPAPSGPGRKPPHAARGIVIVYIDIVIVIVYIVIVIVY